MNLPDLPQPIYPGGPDGSGAGGPQPGAPAGGPAGPFGLGAAPGQGQGYGGHGSGPNGPMPGGPGPSGTRPRTPRLGLWLAVAGGVVVVVALVVTLVVALGRPSTSEAGSETGNGNGTSSGSGTGTGTDTGTGTGTGSGTGSGNGSGTGSGSGSGTATDPVLDAAIAYIWQGTATAGEQACIRDTAVADPSTHSAITTFYQAVSTVGQSDAASLAQVSLACVAISSIEAAVLSNAAVTPYCPEYRFSTIDTATWQRFLTDYFLTLAGVLPRDTLLTTYYDPNYCYWTT